MVLSSVAWPFTQGSPFNVPGEVCWSYSFSICTSMFFSIMDVVIFHAVAEELHEVSVVLFLATQWQEVKLGLQVVKSK